MSEDHFKRAGGKRIGAYDPLVEGVRFLLEMNEAESTEEEQNSLADWITKAIIAKHGHDKYEQEIINFVNGVSFKVSRVQSGRPMKLSDEQVRKVQEIFHWAAAFVLGFERSKGNIGDGDLNDWSKYGPIHHIGSKAIN